MKEKVAIAILVICCLAMVVLGILLAEIVHGETVNLHWQAPTTNVDNTPLVDLSGYRVYYGNTSGNYTNQIDVGNTLVYSVTGLMEGTWYFAITAYDLLGNESPYSNEVSKVIKISPTAPICDSIQ